MEMTTICRFLVVTLLVVLPGQCAPRSKSSHRSAPQTVYDQKQTGDYNIQLHLKDFQIIALLGDDSFEGDYDYNYDYSDFTLKPSTHKPTSGTTSSTQSQPSTSPIPQKPTSTTPKPTTVSNTTSTEPSVTNQKEPIENPPVKQESNSTEVKPSPANTTQKVVEIVESSTTQQSDKYEETNSPGKIKVQIIETPVGIVPGEVTEKDSALSNAEILHQIRRCAQGFTKDKKGRCRRVRRPGSISPQLQYGFGRLANNLASRFRYSSSEESLPSSESTED